jgi:hypothetical protein
MKYETKEKTCKLGEMQPLSDNGNKLLWHCQCSDIIICVRDANEKILKAVDDIQDCVSKIYKQCFEAKIN